MSQRPYLSTDAQKRTFVFIEIDGETFDAWEDYAISSDLMNGADSFMLHAPAMPRSDEGRGNQQTELDARGLRPGMSVKVYVKTPQAERPALQHTGRIDDVELTESRGEGARVTITGRDHMAVIVDSDTLPSIGMENTTYAAVATKYLTERVPGQSTPFFKASDLLIDANAHRILTTGKAAAGVTLSASAPKDLETYKIDQIKPHPGETIFAFLQRHATRFGLLIWGTADGKVVFGRPNYDQKPLYRLALRQGYAGAETNVIQMRRRKSFKHRPSEIHVYGRTKGGDHMNSAVHAVVYDDEVRDAGIFGTLTVHDQNARTKDQATERAKLELSMRRQTGDVLSASVVGHSADDGAIYAIDTIADVQWDKGDIVGDRYIVARTFTRSRGGGTATSLELLPKNAIALGGT